MKQSVLASLIVLGIAAGVIVTGCCRCEDSEDDLAPLVVDTDAPLLLNEPDEAEAGPEWTWTRMDWAR